MKFGIQFQLQTPRPYDAETWGPDDEARIFAQALEQIEHADRHLNPGRDNIYRDFRRKQDAATATVEAQDTAVALEPEDESARALYRMGRRGMFMGSPAYIRENIRAYEAAHVDVLLFLSQCGDRRHEDIMESLELFAREVMPEFKERHGRHQKWREQQLDGVAHPIASSV